MQMTTNSNARQWTLVAVLAFTLALLLRQPGGNEVGMSARQPFETQSRTKTTLSPEAQRGARLAKAVCATCHLFPDPDLLDKVTWGMEVLPAMTKWMGRQEFPFHDYPGGPRIKAAGVVTTTPLLNVEDWRAVCSYYLESAPAQATPQPSRPAIQTGLKQFEIIRPAERFSGATTLVKIDATGHRLFIGDADTKTLFVLNASGKVLGEMPLDSPPVSLTFKSNEMFLTLIGSYLPSDDLEGKIIRLGQPKAGALRAEDLVTQLPRPVDTVFADLNGDGQDDAVVCGFGNVLGRVSWFENRGDNRWSEHPLIDRAGAVKAQVHDFNGDGRPDIVVMMSQSREGVYLLLNQGNGQFTQQAVTEKHPAWGFSHFELVDFDGDGRMDILATNGDNGDRVEHVPPFKSYHGIRWYQNDGRGGFAEKLLFPLNGAYKALARDFDGDGDLDIAAISFFPDYRGSPRESFVYLENQDRGEFTAHSFADSLSGRWLTMDAGDLDGDGRLDIVLGAYNQGPTYVPHLLFEQWQKTGASVLILKNRQP
jgi:hypothetical protein